MESINNPWMTYSKENDSVIVTRRMAYDDGIDITYTPISKNKWCITTESYDYKGGTTDFTKEEVHKIWIPGHVIRFRKNERKKLKIDEPKSGLLQKLFGNSAS